MKKIIAALVLVALVAFAAVFFIDFSGQKDGQSVTVTIREGTSAMDIAKTLKEHKVVGHPMLFFTYAKLSGKSASFKAGEHSLREAMPYSQAAAALVKSPGDKAVTVTIPEGYELSMIADKLAEAGLLERDEFLNEAQNGSFTNSFIADLPKRENRLEGYLFPDTYQFTANMSAHDILQVMLNRFDEIYTDKYRARASELGMTTDEVVTLASVIEREAASPDEARLVSSVFHNRLKSPDYPYLQSCATVQYVLKERKPVLSVADTKINSPYNTYQNKGLPVGPIASPGKSSLEAALYPADTDYLFFVVGKDGKTVFSKTYDEHLSASQ